jgi:hypothetical protein
MHPAHVASCVALAFGASAASASMEATADPARVVLGVQGQVSIHVKGTPQGAALHAAASRGSLQPAPGDGAERVYAWVPPQSHVPDVALLTFWTEGSPPEVAVLSLPLLGRTDVDADTDPDAMVTVDVGGTHFGPVKANKKGRVSVPVEVPPSAKVATVLANAGPQQTTKQVNLDVPPYNPLAVAFTTDPLVAKATNWLIVEEAEVFPPESLGIQFSGATSALRVSRPGWALYEVVPDGSPTGVDVRVTLKDHPEAHAEAHAGVIQPVEPPPPEHTPRAWYPSAELGAFYGGGSNGGVAAALGLGYPLPIPKVPTWVEISAGFRSLGITTTQAGGELDTSVMAVPVELSLRARLFGRDPWSVHARLGGGIDAFWLSSSSLAQPTQTSSGAVPEGMVALEGVFASGPVDLFVQLRGTLAPALTSTVGDVFSGGYLFAGVRYFDR